MKIACNICDSISTELVFESSSAQSLTSLCQFRPGQVRVWQCHQCGHLFSEAFADTREYYASDYRILLSHDEEDQIYDVQDGKCVYRNDHQIEVLTNKIKLEAGTRWLDYGCAKAAMARRLIAAQGALEMHLFDVSSMYIDHWQRFLTPERWAVDTLPAAWHGKFDVVTSFFALEHIPHPQETVNNIRLLLKDDGCFYGIVPHTISNVSDFVVSDHVNHFTESSLFWMLQQAGFSDISIDRQAHRGALVFTARCSGAVKAAPVLDLDSAHKIAMFWSSIESQIQSAERRHEVPSAIYGSGFYGTYIASLLRYPSRLQCFLDASPYQQGKHLMNRRIIDAHDLPASVRVLYIGLNPTIARSTVANMKWLEGRNLEIIFIDGES